MVESPYVSNAFIQCPNISDDPTQICGMGIRMERHKKPGLFPRFQLNLGLSINLILFWNRWSLKKGR